VTRSLAQRLKALCLAVAFLSGTAGAATLHIVQHHWGKPVHHAGSRHVERAGVCFEHADRCPLGLTMSGPRLTGVPVRNVLVPTRTIRPSQTTPHTVGQGILSGRLPPLRGPPPSA